jgi:hypothetical protein
VRDHDHRTSLVAYESLDDVGLPEQAVDRVAWLVREPEAEEVERERRPRAEPG